MGIIVNTAKLASQFDINEYHESNHILDVANGKTLTTKQGESMKNMTLSSLMISQYLYNFNNSLLKFNTSNGFDQVFIAAIFSTSLRSQTNNEMLFQQSYLDLKKDNKSNIINQIKVVEDDPKNKMYDPWNGKCPEINYDFGYQAFQNGPYVYNLKPQMYTDGYKKIPKLKTEKKKTRSRSIRSRSRSRRRNRDRRRRRRRDTRSRSDSSRSRSKSRRRRRRSRDRRSSRKVRTDKPSEEYLKNKMPFTEADSDEIQKEQELEIKIPKSTGLGDEMDLEMQTRVNMLQNQYANQNFNDMDVLENQTKIKIASSLPEPLIKNIPSSPSDQVINNSIAPQSPITKDFTKQKQPKRFFQKMESQVKAPQSPIDQIVKPSSSFKEIQTEIEEKSPSPQNYPKLDTLEEPVVEQIPEPIVEQKVEDKPNSIFQATQEPMTLSSIPKRQQLYASAHTQLYNQAQPQSNNPISKITQGVHSTPNEGFSSSGAEKEVTYERSAKNQQRSLHMQGDAGPGSPDYGYAQTQEIDNDKVVGYLAVKVQGGQFRTKDPYKKFKLSSPFVTLGFNGQKYETAVHEYGGNSPVWGDKFDLEVKTSSQEMLVRLWNKDMDRNSIVGFTNVQLSELTREGERDVWVKILKDGQEIGSILMVVTYKHNLDETTKKVIEDQKAKHQEEEERLKKEADEAKAQVEMLEKQQEHIAQKLEEQQRKEDEEKKLMQEKLQQMQDSEGQQAAQVKALQEQLKLQQEAMAKQQEEMRQQIESQASNPAEAQTQSPTEANQVSQQQSPQKTVNQMGQFPPPQSPMTSLTSPGQYPPPASPMNTLTSPGQYPPPQQQQSMGNQQMMGQFPPQQQHMQQMPGQFNMPQQMNGLNQFPAQNSGFPGPGFGRQGFQPQMQMGQNMMQPGFGGPNMNRPPFMGQAPFQNMQGNVGHNNMNQNNMNQGNVNQNNMNHNKMNQNNMGQSNMNMGGMNQQQNQGMQQQILNQKIMNFNQMSKLQGQIQKQNQLQNAQSQPQNTNNNQQTQTQQQKPNQNQTGMLNVNQMNQQQIVPQQNALQQNNFNQLAIPNQLPPTSPGQLAQTVPLPLPSNFTGTLPTPVLEQPVMTEKQRLLVESINKQTVQSDQNLMMSLPVSEEEKQKQIIQQKLAQYENQLPEQAKKRRSRFDQQPKPGEDQPQQDDEDAQIELLRKMQQVRQQGLPQGGNDLQNPEGTQDQDQNEDQAYGENQSQTSKSQSQDSRRDKERRRQMEKDKLRKMEERSKNMTKSEPRPDINRYKRKERSGSSVSNKQAKRRTQEVDDDNTIENLLNSYITKDEYVHQKVEQDLDENGQPKRYYIKEQPINEKYSIADGRHIENPFVNDKQDPNFDFGEHKSLITEQLMNLIKEYEEKSPPTLESPVTRSGEKVQDPFIADGTSGSILVYFKLYQFFKENKDIQQQDSKYTPNYFMNKAIKSLETNFKLVDKHEKDLTTKNVSFLSSGAGIYTLGALIYDKIEDKQLSQKNVDFFIRKVKAYVNQVFDKQVQYNLLNGLAGYLYCFLIIQTNIKEQKLKKYIVTIVNELYEKGIQKDGTLSWKVDGQVQYGGTHGIIPIIYMMLRAVDVIGKKQFKSRVTKALKTTVTELAKIQLNSGNFPISDKYKDNDEHVYFSQGATSAVLMFLEAYKQFRDHQLKVAAFGCGESVWHRGLVLNGNGLRNGITGNTYPLMQLSSYKNDSKWKIRAHQFGVLSSNQDIVGIIKEISQKAKKHIKSEPDRPMSLMQGIGGDIVMYIDLIQGKQQFPGYEV